MTNKPTGTLKKIYSLEHPNGIPVKPKRPIRKSIVVWKDEQEKKAIENSTGLEKIYHKFFADHNCKLFLDVINKWSVVDSLLVSGDTLVLCEFKKRYINSYDYYTSLLERTKYDNLITAGKLLNAPCIYINEYLDGVICCWFLNPDPDNYKWESQNCQPEDGSSKKIEKQITYLLFEKCDFIISKKTWNKVEYPVLADYFKHKRGDN